jgi:hypothetical protein
MTKATAISITEFVADQFSQGIDIEDYARISADTYEAWGVDEDHDEVRYVVTLQEV